MFQPVPGVVPRLTDQLGPAGHLDVAGPPASLAGEPAVIVPRPDRDAEHKPGRYPPRRDQLREIVPGDIASKKRSLPVRSAQRANRGADGREIQPAEGKRPAGQPDAHHPVPANRGALGGHPVDGRLPGLIDGLYQRPERPRVAPPRHLSGRPRRPPVAG